MNYTRSQKYCTPALQKKIMGPNPVKLLEELMQNHKLSAGATVLDLGSGQGLTSVFLVNEYGFKVYAGDLWSDPQENRLFFDSMGLTHEQITPVKADAENLPFANEFFDGVVSVDSYNYFGRNETYLDEKLLPCVKVGGLIYLSIPGMRKDCHANLPPELLLSWTPEQLEYIRDMQYWTGIFSQSKKAKLLDISEMESNEEAWNDWLECENEYAVNDRKSMRAGADKHMIFISVTLEKMRD